MTVKQLDWTKLTPKPKQTRSPSYSHELRVPAFKRRKP